MPGKRDEYRTQFENASDIAYAHDLTGAIIRVNRAFERITGFAESELVNRNIADFVTARSRHLVQQIINEQIGGGRLAPFELELVTKQGAPASVEVSLRLIFENGMPIGIEGAGRDACSRRRELSNPGFELRTKQNADEITRYTRCLQLLHRLSITSYDTLDALFADYLAAGCEIFGTSHGAISQLSGDRIATRCHRSDGSAPLNDVHARRVLTQGCTLSMDEIFEAGCRHSAYVGTPLPIDGSIYGVLGFWRANSSVSSLLPLQAREIIEMMAKSIGIAIHQRQLTDQLAFQAKHDALTVLPNRQLLLLCLEEALSAAAASGHTVAIAFLDVDRFKQINGTLGHHTGDALLQQIAGRLENSMLSGDTLARMGGDEFTVVFTCFPNPAAAVAKVREMLSALRLPYQLEGKELFATASAGLSFFPSDGSDAATLLCHADAAMYTAKHLGRNDVHCYSAELTAGAGERLQHR